MGSQGGNIYIEIYTYIYIHSVGVYISILVMAVMERCISIAPTVYVYPGRSSMNFLGMVEEPM